MTRQRIRIKSINLMNIDLKIYFFFVFPFSLCFLLNKNIAIFSTLKTLIPTVSHTHFLLNQRVLECN